MRNVVYSTNISIDGFCDHTLFMPDGEMMAYFTGLIKDAGLLVYGRKTYELMVPYWPDVAKARSGTKEENDFAQALTHTPKLVFSRTLAQAGGDTQIADGKLEDEIRKLKQQPGGNISVGGVDLPSQLIASGLIDEFHFVVHPIIVGHGARLFDLVTLQEKLKLKLVAFRKFKSGCIGLHYIKE